MFQDAKSNEYNYKYTTSVEVVPVCKDNVVCLPKQVASEALVLLSLLLLAFRLRRVERVSASDLLRHPAFVAVVFQSLVLGTAYAGAALVAVRLVRPARWVIEPGHWLLAAVGFAGACGCDQEVDRACRCLA